MGDETPEGRIAELLCAVSFATSLGMGEQMDHGLKSAYIGLRMAGAQGLGPDDREAVYYGALLKDVGCTACATAISAFFPDAPNGEMIITDPFSLKDQLGWMRRNVALDRELPGRIAKLLSFMVQCTTVRQEADRTHCEVAEMTARRLGFPGHVQQAVRYQSERWDGRGFAFGLRGDATPIAARTLLLAQMFAFGLTFGGPGAAKELVREGTGGRFDPELAGTLLRLAEGRDFWEVLEQESPRGAVLAMRPPTQADNAVDGQIDGVCEALADIADRKYRGNWYHSPQVADLSVAMGAHLGLSKTQLTELRRAALLHDLGQIAVPAGVLQKAGHLSEAEWELYRLHPYYTHRVLDQVGPLKGLAEDAASHHEWVNGEGYHRGLRSEAIPLGGRVIGVADAYIELGCDPDEALTTMRASVGARFDGACLEALVAAVQGAQVEPNAGKMLAIPGALRLTERETEVLRLLAQGMSNGAIA